MTWLERDPDGGRPIRALHVIGGLDQANGGPSYSVPRLCKATAAETETALFSVAQAGEAPCDQAGAGFRRRSFPQSFAAVPLVAGLRLSVGLGSALRQAIADADLVHAHGLWQFPNIAASRVAIRSGRPLLISPRGMLSPAALSFSRGRKRIVWGLLQGGLVHAADCIHATSDAEYEEIRAMGLSNPVAVIPNGIDLPTSPRHSLDAVAADRIVLSLGRIHPKKGLDRLLHAWAKVEPAHPGWRLMIVGPAEAGHDQELKSLATSLGLSRVSVHGPVYDDDRLRAYRQADLFVLPTLSENFGLTVAESLAAGTPAISTIGAPWSGLRSEGCGWWVDHGVEPLAVALAEAMTLPASALRAMGLRGRAWMERDFSWRRVADDMLSVYGWLARRADAPAIVRFD